MKSTRIRSKNATQAAKLRANWRDRQDLSGYTHGSLSSAACDTRNWHRTGSTSDTSCLVRYKQRLAERRALREAVAEVA